MQTRFLAVQESGGPDLVVQSDSREVLLDGRLLPLTKIEFDILEALASSPRIVISHERLLEIITGSSWYGEGHSLEVHISRLRAKLGESGRSQGFIRTIRGVGYRFEPRPEQSPRGASDGLARPGLFDQRWEFLSNLSGTTYLVRDGNLTLVQVNPEDSVFFGWVGSEMLGRYFTMNPQPALRDNPQAGVRVLQAFADAGYRRIAEKLPVLAADGQILWAYVMRRLHTSGTGKLTMVDQLIRPWSDTEIDDGPLIL